MVTKRYKFCLWKAYFEKGYALTSYIKYIIALFGLSSLNVKLTLILGFVYGISCLIIGRVWWVYRLIDEEYEVQNNVNPYVREVRKAIKNERFKYSK